MMEKIEAVLVKEQPDWVLVYGDTDSTLAGALAAVKLHIRVAHVEAGLRSYNRAMPEEINRVLTDHVADLLFAPTLTAVKNLKKEGISGTKVIQTGDVMYDAAMYYKSSAQKPDGEGLPESDFVLCTVHRAENTDDPERLRSILAAIETIADTMPIVLPLHPRTQKTILEQGYHLQHKQVHLIDPVGYLQMVWLLERCRMVMTDSGGLQKEAYFFQKPCVTLRDETEWVELVTAGVNQIAGADQHEIVSAFEQARNKTIDAGSLYGDGHSAQQIVEVLLNVSNIGFVTPQDDKRK